MSTAHLTAATNQSWSAPSQADMSALEDRKTALREIDRQIAEKMAAADGFHVEIDLLYARRHVIDLDVKDLRRRVGRINCLLGDGSRIFDLEVVS